MYGCHIKQSGVSKPARKIRLIGPHENVDAGISEPLNKLTLYRFRFLKADLGSQYQCRALWINPAFTRGENRPRTLS